MNKQKKNEGSGEKTARKSNSGGKTTEELTKRHMKDKNDKITDEDIRNIRIDNTVDPDEGLSITSDDERPHDVDKDHKIGTPWDLIKE